MLHARTLACLVLILGGLLAPAAAADDAPSPRQQLQRRGLTLLSRLAVPRRAMPDWARRLEDRAPRFTVAVLADIHLGRSDARLRKALAKVRELAPTFVVLLGDNVNRAVTSEHARLKGILDAELRCPVHVVKGDNDARAFTTVFGATHWSFRYGGVRFVGTGIDIDAEGKGIGRLAPATWTWLRAQLAQHRDVPTVLFHHEPAMPPTFLDAPKLTALVGRHRQLRAVLHGHLHVDLELTGSDKRSWWTLPAVGPNARHGFKLLRIYPEALVAETYEDSGEGYARANKWQRASWGGLAPAESAPLRFSPKVTGPSSETVFDPSLERSWRLFELLLRRKR